LCIFKQKAPPPTPHVCTNFNKWHLPPSPPECIAKREVWTECFVTSAFLAIHASADVDVSLNNLMDGKRKKISANKKNGASPMKDRVIKE